MDIRFDPVKDASNQDKHGCSLSLAHQFEWQDAVIWRDERFDYGEDRFVAMGYVGLRLFVTVYVERDGARRIISLRKANARERTVYAQT